MREYQPIWEAIKKRKDTDPPVRVTIHRNLHRRLIKAVVKEKWMDFGYKLECSEMVPAITTELIIECKGAIVTFTLVKTPSYSTADI